MELSCDVLCIQQNMTSGTILSQYTRISAESTVKSVEDNPAWVSFLPKTFSSSHLLNLLHTWNEEMTLSVPRGYSKRLFLHMYISHSMTAYLACDVHHTGQWNDHKYVV